MFLTAISRATPTELGICLVVPVSINISPLAGLESLKLIREDFEITTTSSVSFGRSS